MNLPNIITLSRVPLMFVIVWLMYLPGPGVSSLAFWLFIIAAVGDWYDGYLARKMKLVSTFGKLMDALADKVMVIGLMIAFVDFHIIPVFWVLLTMSREFLVSGMRMVAAVKGVAVAADRRGKTKTLTQLIAIGFLLGAPMIERDIAPLLGLNIADYIGYIHMIGLGLFILGTGFAVSSGTAYIWRHRDVVFDEDE
ncbi:MAG: CDP-diacylglycerol--glycerol-3-phosphate 3-phosphatidyltransferase [Candidatus Synoicihabitans palmerolidicus]|nr:CDP-diacylglycerol--glycerol-3-phosphate 3-phosphatidyltransferase [Candidatus Synoicihabitans palmerolidicus]